MTARIIDGKGLAAKLRGKVARKADAFAQKAGRPPALAVILVGDDPASEIYVRRKSRLAGEAGIRALDHRLPATTSQDALLGLIGALNRDDNIDAILLQMPLPGHLDSAGAINAIDPQKDVDGLTPHNAGLLACGRTDGIVPCTPRGCMILARSARGADLAGLSALVIGRSVLVGIPVALLLQQAHCTVTLAHSRTQDMPELCRRMDIVVAAAGRAQLVRSTWVKPGATVIDVGINRCAHKGSDGHRIVGDVDFDALRGIAGAITPVPGGVGPMTIACLLANTVQAAGYRQDPAIQGFDDLPAHPV